MFSLKWILSLWNMNSLYLLRINYYFTALLHCQFFPLLWSWIPTDVAEHDVRLLDGKLSATQVLMAFNICSVFICCPNTSSWEVWAKICSWRQEGKLEATAVKPRLPFPATMHQLGIALAAARVAGAGGQEPAMICRDGCSSAVHPDNFISTSVSHSRTASGCQNSRGIHLAAVMP